MKVILRQNKIAPLFLELEKVLETYNDNWKKQEMNTRLYLDLNYGTTNYLEALPKATQDLIKEGKAKAPKEFETVILHLNLEMIKKEKDKDDEIITYKLFGCIVRLDNIQDRSNSFMWTRRLAELTFREMCAYLIKFKMDDINGVIEYKEKVIKKPRKVKDGEQSAK